MRVKTLERIFVGMQSGLKDELQNLQEGPRSCLWKLINATKEVVNTGIMLFLFTLIVGRYRT